ERDRSEETPSSRRRREAAEKLVLPRRTGWLPWALLGGVGFVVLVSFITILCVALSRSPQPPAAPAGAGAEQDNKPPDPVGEIRVLAGHAQPVEAVAFAPDGRTALSASWDRTLRLWDMHTGQTLRTFTGHSKAVHAVAFLPGGRQALSASWDRTVKLWDV